VSCHEWELCIDACSDTCSVSLAARVQFGACHARHSRPCLREHARRAAGGWFSLMMAAIYACIMMLWQWGSTRKHAFFDSHSVPLESFLRMSEQARRRHQRSRAAGSLVCSSTGCFSSALSAPPCCTRSTLTAQGKLGHLHGMQAHASILRLTGGALLACRHLVLAPVLANMAAQAVQTLVRRLLRRRRPLKDAIK